MRQHQRVFDIEIDTLPDFTSCKLRRARVNGTPGHMPPVFRLHFVSDFLWQCPFLFFFKYIGLGLVNSLSCSY
jgi:hypothetical protein